MMLFNENYHINTVFSNDNAYVNYDKWKSGEINKLFILGLMGASKSTTCRRLAKQYNCKFVEFDKFMGQTYYTDYELQRDHPIIYEYFKDVYEPKYGSRMNIKTIHGQNKYNKQKEFLYWVLDRQDRVIIEGFVSPFIEDDENLMRYPMIFISTSVLTSAMRMMKRQFSYTIDNWKNGYYELGALKVMLKMLTKYNFEQNEQNRIRDKIINHNDGKYEQNIDESFLPELTMYHGSVKKFDKVKPLAFSAGNRLRDPSWSVFMLRQYELALNFALADFITHLCKDNDIEPSFCAYLEKDGFMHYHSVVFGANDVYDKVKALARGNKVYVYTLKVPIDSKLNIIGTTSSLPEYVYDGEPETIKRDEITITDKLLDSIVNVVSRKELERLFKLNPSRNNVVGPWLDLFIDYDERIRVRKAVKEKLKSGEIKPGDDLGWLKESNIPAFTNKPLYSIYNKNEERDENDFPLLVETTGYKHHPVIFSDDDIYINYDKWKSGECTSLLVTGLSGGGKSTLSKKLAEKFNAYYIEIDVISFKIGILHPDRANWEYIKKNDKYLYKFFKENNIPPTIMTKFKNYQDIKKSTIINEYIYWLCFERDDLDKNRVVIEGGDVAIALSDIKELSTLPIIIKGTSLAKSLFRRCYRILDKGYGIWHILQRIFEGTFYSQYSKMYSEVDNARRSVMNQEYDEIHESYKHTFTHKQLCSIYDKKTLNESSEVHIPHISGNITQSIPGSYFNEDVGAWMRKPNAEELVRLSKIDINMDFLNNEYEV